MLKRSLGLAADTGHKTTTVKTKLAAMLEQPREDEREVETAADEAATAANEAFAAEGEALAAEGEAVIAVEKATAAIEQAKRMALEAR